MGTLNAAKHPLCVDLDGTLLQTDLLHEALVKFIKQRPWYVFHMLLWACKGPAYFKEKIFTAIQLDIENLPINRALYKFLTSQKESGTYIVLASASPQKMIESIANQLGLFEQVHGTTTEHNLKGSNKAAKLVELYGKQGFDYVGDARVDLKVWRYAKTAHVVGSEKLLQQLPDEVQRGQVFARNKLGFTGLLKALRIHQWAKNLLVFVPALMAHTIFDTTILLQGIFAFMSLSFMASAIYLLNDLFDLEADRKHMHKSNRPLANGSLRIAQAVFIIPLLLTVSVLTAVNLPIGFFYALIGYFFATTLYSFWLKQIVLLDIFTLAGLYTLRIIAGGLATTTIISPWLLAFALFAFLSLACAKRAAELHNVICKQQQLPGRGYRHSDLDQVARFGSTSGYLSVLVLALYINSPVVMNFYQTPWSLWLLCPLVLFWFSRIWLLTSRGELDEDPVLFSLTDIPSYIILILSLFVLFLSI